MKIGIATKLIAAHTYCPQCGNNLIGNGEGGFIIEEDSFERWCKCGFSVCATLKKKEGRCKRGR